MTLRAGGLAVMLLAIFAFAATVSASATVLCTDSECTTVYPTGTELSFSLKSGTTSALKTTGGAAIATCTGSTVSGKTSNESGATISVSIESLAWGGCNQTTDTVATGSLSIEGFSGTENGVVSGSGSQVTFGVFGVSCTYVKGGPATLGQHKFFTGQRTITCNKATLTSPAFETPTGGLTVTPQYEECTSGLGLPATVKPNQCAYAVGVSGTFKIQSCIAKMELIVYKNAAEHAAGNALCRYKVGNQNPAGRSLTFANGGVNAGQDIAFRLEVKELAVEKVEGANAECGVTGNIGTYEGTTTMKAFDSAPPNAQVGWWRGE